MIADRLVRCLAFIFNNNIFIQEGRCGTIKENYIKKICME
jgi:hypothetical protein